MWLAAVQALHVVMSMAEVKDVETWMDTFIEMATGRKQPKREVTPEQFSRIGRGGYR